MIKASRWYEAGVDGPAGNRGIKSVGIAVEDDAGWRHEQIVYIDPGTDPHEQEQLGHALEKILKAHGRVGPWSWV